MNRTVAKHYFGDANPVGQTLIWRTGHNLNATLQPFDAPFGAEVLNVDASREFDDETVGALKDAIDPKGILLARG